MFSNLCLSFPSQNHDEFEDFCTKFYLLMSNIKNEFPLWLMLDAQGGGKITLLTQQS